jgi:hypothetical protein
MTPLFKKLNLKDQRSIHVVQAPDSFQAELKAISKTVSASYSVKCFSDRLSFFWPLLPSKTK